MIIRNILNDLLDKSISIAKFDNHNFIDKSLCEEVVTICANNKFKITYLLLEKNFFIEYISFV